MVQTEGNEELSMLSHSIQNLIDSYGEAEKLLKSQIQAVIENDFEILNQLINQQLEHYKKLSGLELNFREKLSNAYKKINKDNSTPKLSKLIHLYNGRTGRLYILREDLILQVNRVKSLSLQLLDLLKYAQDMNVNTLRTVIESIGKQDIHYNNRGQTDGGKMANLSIDQKG